MNSDSIFQENYNILNDAQKKVVEEIYGPIMVVAGPGTGKTQIIALRTANIIKKGGINPENILITTFTEAGVIAIKKRLSRFIGTESYKVKISTIHSFAQDVLSKFPEKFAQEKAGQTIDDIGALQSLVEIMEDLVTEGKLEYLFNAFDRQMYLRDVKDRIGKLKGEGISPEKFDQIISDQRTLYDEQLDALKDNKRIRDLEKRTQKDSENYKKHIGKLTELNQIYKRYNEYLKKHRLYDFSDMINFVLNKMRTDDELRSYYAEKYQFIMIDEYQDTNNPQNEIMDLILSVTDEKNIMVVGDDDQSIYRFQGANIENMLDFYTKYPETQFIVLENNYRSAQSILNLSTELISNNSERLVNRLDFLDKKLIAQSQYKDLDLNESVVLSDDLSEKNYVREKIQGITDAAPQETIAIIVRSNREVLEWTDFFTEQGIQVDSKLKTNILENVYVRFIIDFLEILDNPSTDNTRLIEVMRSSVCDVENLDVITLARELYKKNYARDGFQLSFWELLSTIDIDYAEQYREEENYSFETRQEQKFRDYKKLLAFRNLIIDFQEFNKKGNGGTLVSQVIEKLGLIPHIEQYGSFSDLEDVYTLFNKIKQIQSLNPDITLSDLINTFRLHKKYKVIIPRQILKQTDARIEILTAHSSKGLEYDYVYIPGMYGGNWESKRMIDKLKLPLGMSGSGLQFAGLSEKEQKNIEKETQAQEDRRLFFVAVTRAKKSVCFTRPAGKENKPYIESPFLIELGIETVVKDSELTDVSLQDSMKKTLLGPSLTHTSDEEIEYISEFLENYKLSPTDLNMFLEDPKIFLKNVVFKYPFDGNEFTIFGNVYHKVLEDAIKKKFNGEEPSLDSMTENFSKLLSGQLLTQEEQKRLEKKGIDGLSGYFEYFQNNPRQTLQVEYNFRPKNIVFDGIPITGKIDKIEKMTDSINEDSFEGQGTLFSTKVALVDYKTGSVKSTGIIKGVDRYGNKKDDMSQGKYYRQLLFYKLLAENDSEFRKDFSVGELALDFVEGRDGKYSYTSVDLEAEDFEDFKDLVKDSRKKINDIDFWKETLKN